jgi:hypothetical protein
MATYTDTTLPSNLTNDADFRSWGSKIAAGIASVGLVQTADTGQINWTTVTKPTLANTSAGYEIYRFNDTLQATAPVFIKVEYGTGASAAIFSLWITVGNLTNGAGSFTGAYVSARRQIAAQSTSASSSTLWVSGSTNRLSLFTGLAATTNFSTLVVIERTHDAAGADTNDGVYVLTGSVATSQLQQIIPFPKNNNYPPVPAAALGGIVYPGLGSVSSFGGDVAVSPPMAFLGKPYYFLGVLAHINADIGAGGTFIVSLLGSNHTFISMAGMSNNSGVNGSTSSHAISLRWE